MADSVFTTPRSAVRRWCRADIDDLFAACTDAEAMRWVGDGRPTNRPERGQWLDLTLTKHDRRGYGMIALQLRDHADGRRTRCFEWSAAPRNQPDPPATRGPTPMNDISVRQAVLADLDAIATLFDLYRVFQGQPSDRAAAKTFLRSRFDHGESVVFIAFDGTQAVGLTQLFPSYSSASLARVFILNDLFVHASVRRQGVAMKLLAAFEQHAWSLGAVRVTLNVARDNLPGQALYAARGWRQDAQFQMFHRDPAQR